VGFYMKAERGVWSPNVSIIKDRGGVRIVEFKLMDDADAHSSRRIQKATLRVINIDLSIQAEWMTYHWHFEKTEYTFESLLFSGSSADRVRAETVTRGRDS
jgi:hypothetical protein